MSRKPPAHQVPDPSPREPFRHRALELLALFALIAVSAVIYLLAGPAGFSAVISAGGALFATWKSRR
jgi:hypothetical protein